MVKWISVKIVVDGKDESRCDPSCPHYDQFAQHGGSGDLMETCRVYHRLVPQRKRCDECRGAKEL